MSVKWEDENHYKFIEVLMIAGLAVGVFVCVYIMCHLVKFIAYAMGKV